MTGGVALGCADAVALSRHGPLAHPAQASTPGKEGRVAEVLTCPLRASEEKLDNGSGTGETPTTGPLPVKVDDVVGVAELYWTVIVRVTVMVPKITVDAVSAAIASGRSGKRYRYIISIDIDMSKNVCSKCGERDPRDCLPADGLLGSSEFIRRCVRSS